MNNPAVPDPFAAFESLGDATGFVDRILEIIEHINLLGDLEHNEIEVLARFMKCYRVPMGAEVIHEGEPGDFMLLLLHGSVEILKTDPRGLPQRLAVAGPGKTLGEMSLIDGEPRFASCVTLEPVEFAVLTSKGLVEVISEEPRTGVKFLMSLLMLLNQRLRSVSGELMKCLENQRLRIR
jgi:CRP-like cAMP-binding protein